MTITRKRMITCEKCGKEYEVETYDVIDANGSPEIRDRIIRNKLFRYCCPHCKTPLEKMYSFFYVDHTNNFKIQFGPKAKLLEYEIPEDSNYIEVGCVDSRDLVSKITTLENGLDYVVEKVIEVFVQEYLESDEKNEELQQDLLFLLSDNYGDLEYVYLYTNQEDEVDYNTIDFPYELYIQTMEKLESMRSDKTNFYIFDMDAAKKFLRQDEYEDSTSELAILDTYNGMPITVRVPDFNIGKFKENDVVIAYDEGDLIKGKIKKIIQSNEKYSLLFEEDLPALLYREKSICLETKEDSNFELINPELVEMFISKSTGLDEKKVINSNIIVGVSYEIPLEGLLSEEGEYVNVKTSIDDTYKEDKRYINVYLESKDVKDSSLTKHIYSFNDVINLVLNDPYSFDGICMISNDKTKIVSHEALYRYKKNRAMAIKDNMKELLFELKENEIEYLGQETYDLIAYIYNEDCPLSQTKEHFNYSDGQVDKLLSEGYFRLGQIAICNY